MITTRGKVVLFLLAVIIGLVLPRDLAWSWVSL